MPRVRSSSAICWSVVSRNRRTISTGVSTWADQSVNGRNFTQGTGSAQPSQVTNQVNGKTVVRFDGSNDVMSTSSFSLSAPIHIFALVKTSNDTNRCFNTRVSANDGFTIVRTASNTLKWGENTAISNTNHTDGNYEWLEMLVNGASSSFKINSTTAATGTASGSDLFAGMTLGAFFASLFSACDIAEVIVCNTAEIAGSDLTSLRSYASTRYGLF